MKTTLFVTIIVALSFSSCSNDKNEDLVPLTDNEISNLKFLREEEKLAHDVYIFSYDRYQENIFNPLGEIKLIDF